MPGEHRQDAEVTSDVKRDKHLGEHSGKWVKALYPAEALAPIKKIAGEAASYHAAVTLPFDRGTGILPAVLIMEYTDKMRNFKGQIDNLVETHFLAKRDDWIAWARTQHNGSFDLSLYPEVAELRQKFYFRTEPIPVPDSAHFANTVASLLGTDTESVDARVADAAKEAQQELLRRMIDPVANMVKVLSSDKPRIFDTLVSNVDEICRLAPALNLAGDPAIDSFVADMKKLTQFKADDLRELPQVRKATAVKAEEIAKRLSGYRF
jgi:hypothetical protein